MTEQTPRFALPLLQAGQAQKELDHNEALALVDAALHPLAQTVGDNAPPIGPTPGQSWVVGTAPTDAWAGRADALALWTGGGWRFLAPVVGMTIWCGATGRPARWDGSGWRDGDVVAARIVIAGTQVVGARRAAIADPAGGGAVDLEARAAITAILAALRGHGLIAE